MRRKEGRKIEIPTVHVLQKVGVGYEASFLKLRICLTEIE